MESNNNQTFNIPQQMIMTSRNSLLTDGISPHSSAINSSSFDLQSYLYDLQYYTRDDSDEASSLGGVGNSSSAICNNSTGHNHGLQENLNNLAISVPHQIYSSNGVLSGFVSTENYNNNNGYVTYNDQTSAFHQTFDQNVWNSNRNNNHIGSSEFSNELSLSLATSQPSVITGMTTTIPGQCSASAMPTRNTTETMLVSEQASCSNNRGENLSPSFGSYRPLQLSQVILGSRYLSAAQEILAHIASFSLENISYDHHYLSGNYLMNSCSFSTMSPMDSTPDGGSILEGETESETRRRVTETKRAKLLSLLQMVDERYNQCMDEIHTVVSAFHAATELDPQIHARFALQTMSVLYKGLRERISKHWVAMEMDMEKNKCCVTENEWGVEEVKKKKELLWRPQRGLPERSVSVLKAWMFQNFLHPYPKDTEKQVLAMKSGLTKNQVSNWFINARVRLWKPMIEEMYAELNKRNQSNNNNNQRISINHNIINQIQRYN
uniref:Homeobox domain-containing protein n=2 Tax=Cannabis sativa TaxID=3483 RepID=A0A803NG46_CANSA